MSELREVFEMVTKQTEPDLDSWRQQEDRQRRTSRKRKLGAIALVAALIVGVLVVSTVPRSSNEEQVDPAGSGKTTQPLDTPSPPACFRCDRGAQVIGLDGTVVGALSGLPNAAEGLRLSPDGSTVAFMSGGQVATIEIDGTNMRVLTPEPNANAGDAQNAVSWSPDGTQIAYAFSGEIYLMDADGSNVRQLTTDPDGDYYPAWSPDGTRIAYWNGSTTGQDGGPTDAELYTIPVGGGTPTRLTNNDIPEIEPAWSPDGEQIAYFSPDRGDLRVMRANGTRDRAVFTDGNSGWAPSWSPDGSRIAFLTCCRGTPYVRPLLVVRVLTLASGEITDLTADGLDVTVHTDLNGPAWTPDGALLVNRLSD